MKNGILIVFCLILLLSPTLISYEEKEPGHGLSKSFACSLEDRPRPFAGDLRYFLTKCGDYHEWKFWPGKEKFFAGKEPHSPSLVVYVNKVTLDSLNEKKGMKSGSIIVSENYSSDNMKLQGIYVMYKVETYNPEAGDWFWVKYDANFEILEDGKVKACIDCHSKEKANDYIFTGKIK